MNIRYFMYLILMSMLVNAIVYIPNILFQEKLDGGLPSMFIAIPLSTLMAYLFSRGMMKFQGMGLTEIFQVTLPKWVRIPVLLYLGVMWYIGGSIVLIAFAILSNRYISPDTSLFFTFLFFLLLAGWGALQSSKTILYISEIIILLNVPFIFFIITKALSSPYMRWDEVLALGSFMFQWPKWSSLSAATYLFIGYINIVTLNREFGNQFTTKFHWVIPILGIANFVTSFAVPIGFHGFEGVNHYTYPWVATADSLRMSYGFVERVLFVFLLLYISISLLFGMVVWHVAIDLLKSVFETKKESSWKKYLPTGIVCLFVLPLLYISTIYDYPHLISFTKSWLNLRLISEILLVGAVFTLSLRRGKT